MRNKNGFTLIELLAVIVILGILMLIAIPSVTKYIDSSKKEAYIKSLNSMVDAVRYGLMTETGIYNMQGETSKTFYLNDIELEKGSKKSPYGNLEKNYSYILVTKTEEGYKYELQVKDDTGYCIGLTNVDFLTKEDVKKCENVMLVEPAVYEEYSIGDVVTFAGSNWYVINNSSKAEDYVTIMKEKVLNNSELGEYAAKDSYDTMSYYWSDKCHWGYGYYGYTSQNVSECSNYKYYAKSKIKEYLEGTYINTLGANNLKEIDLKEIDENYDGKYKIRLITLEELQTNLGWTDLNGYTTENSNSNVPKWVYEDFGENVNNVYHYWTMTYRPDVQGRIYNVSFSASGGYIGDSYVTGDYYQNGVRPVINLLKSSINTD